MREGGEAGKQRKLHVLGRKFAQSPGEVQDVASDAGYLLAYAAADVQGHSLFGGIRDVSREGEIFLLDLGKTLGDPGRGMREGPVVLNVRGSPSALHTRLFLILEDMAHQG